MDDQVGSIGMLKIPGGPRWVNSMREERGTQVYGQGGGVWREGMVQASEGH